MRTTRVQILLASLVVCALAATSAQAQTAEANYKFERGFPVADTAKRAYDASDLRRAIEAYKFFYPTISTEAVMQQGQAAGAKLNEVGIVMATSPRQQFGAANNCAFPLTRTFVHCYFDRRPHGSSARKNAVSEAVVVNRTPLRFEVK